MPASEGRIAPTHESPVRDGNAGAHINHFHSNAAEQATRDLLGAFIVEPKGPATQPVVARKGDRVLIRWMNESLMIHPMHGHGMFGMVTATIVGE